MHATPNALDFFNAMRQKTEAAMTPWMALHTETFKAAAGRAAGHMKATTALSSPAEFLAHMTEAVRTEYAAALAVTQKANRLAKEQHLSALADMENAALPEPVKTALKQAKPAVSKSFEMVEETLARLARA